MSTAGREPTTVEELPDLPEPSPAWRRLGLASGNPFSTWEWASAWWRHFGAGRRQRVLGCLDESGEAIGVLPLYLASRRPARVLRLIGHGQANELGPVCRPEHREAIAGALGTALAEDPDWDLCVVERVDATDGWPALLGGVVTRTEGSPTIRLRTSDWDQFLASKSANFRQQARRFERRLESDHSVRYRLAEDPERLEEDMDTFFALHKARWASSGGSISFAGPREQFHRDLASLALEAGFLRLSFLELDGVPRAASYCFRLGGADWFFQSGRDPAFDRERIGTVHLNRVVREAVEAGMSEFKLLLGEHEYKSRYATEEPVVKTLVLGRNRLTRAALRMAVPVRTASRRLVDRLREPPAHGR